MKRIYYRSLTCGFLLCLCAGTAQAQIKYNDANEIKAAELGVERVACYFSPRFHSEASNNDEVRWFQIDLGSKKTFSAIKLLPGVQGFGPAVGGFPARFKIEVSDDSTFAHSILYEDYSLGNAYPIVNSDFPNPDDKVVTFDTKEVSGRYIRLTANKLRNERLAMTKVMVMSGGKDIAEGCKAKESNPNPEHHVEMLTSAPRPQGEFVVTDNPQNVIPQKSWKPVAYKAEAPLGGVTLGEGIFKKTMEQNIGYLLNSYTFDQLVRNFRVKAGLPVEPFDDRLNIFWFKQLPGSEAGRFLMGAGNTLRWMENAALRKEMNDIVDVIDQCKEPDGYLMAYPKHTIFAVEYGAYTRAWVTHGLIEAGYAGNPKAFGLLRGFYDWFDHCAFLPEMLRRPKQGVQGIIPMTRTYFTPVGKPEDIQVVQRYFQENYWMEGMAKRDPEVIWHYPYDRPHNYLVTAIEPYFDLYRATGAQKYLDAVEGAWDLYHDNWEHIGGSLAINEGSFFYPPKSLYLRKESGELCGNVFWARLNQRFHLLKPTEEKYVNEIEKSIYNVAIPNQYGSQGIRYFAKMVDRKDGPPHETVTHCTNSCCEGQGTRFYGSLPEYIYSIAKDGIYVDLYTAAEISYKIDKQDMNLKMETQFPYGSDVKLTMVNAGSNKESQVCLRVPSWSFGPMAIKVNGQEVGQGQPGSYFPIKRQWKSGDEITLTLPANIRLTKYVGIEPGYQEHHYAMEYGPVLMALVSVSGKQENSIGLKTSPEKVQSLMKPIPGKPLHFSIEGNPDFEYWPYFEVQDEPFSCFPEFAQ